MSRNPYASTACHSDGPLRLLHQTYTNHILCPCWTQYMIRTQENKKRKMLLKLRNATNVRWWSSSFVVAATDTSIKSRCPMPPHPEQPLDAYQDRYTSGDSTRSDLYALPQESRARSRSSLREPPRVRARDVYGCGQGVAEGVSSSFSIGHVACIKIMWKKWSATRSSASKTDQNSNTRTSLRSRRMSSRSSNWILTTIQHFLTRRPESH